ncbi:YncE family protein [Taibaiella soli]|nr:YncE family protein [Taibaiella soli]
MLQSFPVAGNEKWDYLAINPTTNNLYIAHGSQVNIINKVNGDSVGVLNNTSGVHGVAFVPALNKGFMSNGKLNTVTVFDMQTNVEIVQIPVGQNPDAIMYEPVSGYVFVGNGKSANISVIDPKENKLLKSIDLGGKPETAVSDNAGKLYVNIEDKSEIVVLDVKSLAVEAHWPLGAGKEPSGLAIDPKQMKLFAGCDNEKLIVMDAKTGKAEQELPIEEECDGVAFDPVSQHIFSANGEGTLTVIARNANGKYYVAQNVKTRKGARTLTVDPTTNKIYLPVADSESPAGENAQKHTKPVFKPGSFRVLVVGI